jgi:dephospho-CoA kinase
MNNTQIVSTGEAVRTMMRERGIELTHETLQEFNSSLKQELGDRYISIIYSSIDEASSIVLVDALRTAADYAELRRHYAGRFFLVGMSSDEEIRYARLVGRKRAGDVRDRDEFNSLSARERKWGVEELLDRADVQITNNFLEPDTLFHHLRTHQELRFIVTPA